MFYAKADRLYKACPPFYVNNQIDWREEVQAVIILQD